MGNERNFKYKVNNEDEISYDFSRAGLTQHDFEETRNKLDDLEISLKIKEVLLGKNVNFTENLAELHYLLRGTVELGNNEKTKNNMEPSSINEATKNTSEPVVENLRKEIEQVLEEMKNFEIQFDSLKSSTGKQFKYIFNLGIGGSDLGPKLVNTALHPYKKRSVFFFSNVDSSNLFMQLDGLLENKKLPEILEESFFIVVSKSWTTAETLNNIKMILEMFEAADLDPSKAIEKQIVAVTANKEACIEYKKNQVSLRVFKMVDYVCGRYSLYSAVGLSIVLGIGYENFTRLLNGAHQADEDFFKNLFYSVAAHAAIVEIFHSNINNKCYAAYDSHLSVLPFYLQQAEMESNGKMFSRQKIVWGGVGTDVQHSFFQYLHQNDNTSYVEFLIPITNQYLNKHPKLSDTINRHHKILVSNALAQAKAFCLGNNSDANEITRRIEKRFKERNEGEFNQVVDVKMLKKAIETSNKIKLDEIIKTNNIKVANEIRKVIVDETKLAHKGKKPSTTIKYTKLSPEVLGFILGTYEHKVFVEGVFWGCNSFDQFGVRLGKEMALEIEKEE